MPNVCKRDLPNPFDTSYWWSLKRLKTCILKGFSFILIFHWHGGWVLPQVSYQPHQNCRKVASNFVMPNLAKSGLKVIQVKDFSSKIEEKTDHLKQNFNHGWMHKMVLRIRALLCLISGLPLTLQLDGWFNAQLHNTSTRVERTNSPACCSGRPARTSHKFFRVHNFGLQGTLFADIVCIR